MNSTSNSQGQTRFGLDLSMDHVFAESVLLIRGKEWNRNIELQSRMAPLLPKSCLMTQLQY